MNKKIFSVFISLFVVAMFAVPVMAKTETPITYTKVRIGPMTLEYKWTGESHIFQILRSEQSGVVYEGDQNLNDPSSAPFSFTAIGKNSINTKQNRQVWHFDIVWTSNSDPNSGYEGRLNGKAGGDSLFTVQGILQGFGELQGQKLVVECERQEPISAGIGLYTGFIITH